MAEKKNLPEIRFKGFDGEWENRKLGDVANFSKGQGYSKGDLLDEGTPIVLYGRMYTNYQAIIDEVDTYALPRQGSIYSNGHEVIVPASGETAEDIARASAIVSTGVLLGGDLNIIYPYNIINSLFLALNISNGKPQRELSKRAQGKSVVHLRNNDLKEVALNYPNPIEQFQIGTYFQNLDKLITLHQRKYDKLVTLKKAMLEKMFPKNGADIPEIRFKGFKTAWEEKRLGEIGNTYTGLSGKTKDDFGHGEGKYVTYMNIFSNPVSNRDITEPIEIDNNQNEVQFGDVFFTTSSETPEEVGMSSVWLENLQNVYLNSFCFGYRPTVKMDSYFLAYMLRSFSFRKKIIFLAQGISRYNISKNKVMEISILIPDIDEQKKVGNYFKNLDSLIALNKTELEKLKNIKKACLEKMFV